MQQVLLSDEIFEHARRRAGETGYASVAEYLADIVVGDAAPARGLEAFAKSHPPPDAWVNDDDDDPFTP